MLIFSVHLEYESRTWTSQMDFPGEYPRRATQTVPVDVRVPGRKVFKMDLQIHYECAAGIRTFQNDIQESGAGSQYPHAARELLS